MYYARTNRGLWVRDAQVYLPGDASATSERETWAMFVVLEVGPRGVDFVAGWQTAEFVPAEFYSEPIKTVDARFAVRVGPEGVWIVVRPIDRRTQLHLTVHKQTSKEDPSFRNLAFY